MKGSKICSNIINNYYSYNNESFNGPSSCRTIFTISNPLLVNFNTDNFNNKGVQSDNSSPPPFTFTNSGTTTGNYGKSTISGAKRGSSNSDVIYEGVFTVTVANMNTTLRSPIPTMLYFHTTLSAEVVKFTSDLSQQITLANKQYRSITMVDNYQNCGVFNADSSTNESLGINGETADGGGKLGNINPERGLTIKLATVDVVKETKLAKQFNIDPHHFPLVLFIYNQNVIDRLEGIVTEVQIKDAIDAFIRIVRQDIREKREKRDKFGESYKGSKIPFDTKVPRMDVDDENVMTLIQLAQKKLKDNDYNKGVELYKKAVAIGRSKVDAKKVELGLDGLKRPTVQLLERLRREEPHYFALAQALSGLAMCHCAQKRFEEAKALVREIRTDFPVAVKDLRDVAEAVVRIELLSVAEYDLEKDNYVSLMKREECINDPVKFYQTNVKLAAAHLFEKRHKAGIDECLRLIRSEPKLMPALKSAGVVDQNFSLSSPFSSITSDNLGGNTTGSSGSGSSTDIKSKSNSTPARRVLFLIFEALGNNNELVIEGRKKLSSYLSL